MSSAATYQQALQKIIDEVITPSAPEVDGAARFPRQDRKSTRLNSSHG